MAEIPGEKPVRTYGCDRGQRPKERDLTDTGDGCGGVRGEQKLSMSFMGKGSRSNLGHVEFEERGGHSGRNSQLQLELRRESEVVPGRLKTLEIEEILCGAALAQGTTG